MAAIFGNSPALSEPWFSPGPPVYTVGTQIGLISGEQQIMYVRDAHARAWHTINISHQPRPLPPLV